MRIIDVIKIKGDIVAICDGEDLPMRDECKRISVCEKIFDVNKYDPIMSFSGHKSALIGLANVVDISDIPIGDFRIISI